MKKTILLVFTLSIFCAFRMFATNPCAPNQGITFTNVSNTGGVIIVNNVCTGTCCEYTINTCGSGGETICFDGVTDVYSSGCGCPASTLSDFETTGMGSPCMQISIVNYTGLITATYSLYYDAGSSQWTITFLSGPKCLINGVEFPDIEVTVNENGTLGVALTNQGGFDESGNQMVF